MISHLNFDNWQNWPLYSKIAEIKALFNNITQFDFKWVFFTIFFMLIFLSDREPCCWGGGLSPRGSDHSEEAWEAGQGGV